MKYTLELTEKQAEIIKIALEEYFRIRMGQFDDLSRELAFTGFNYDKSNKENSEKFNVCVERMSSSQIVFEVALNVAQPMRKHGVCPEQTIEMLQAQDIWQVIRHKLYIDRGGDPNGWCVDAREPLKMSDEPLPKMEVVEE